MADRGITFSGAMVRALLDGRKTQTRRLLSPQPPEQVTSAGSYSNSIEGPTNRWSWLSGDPRDMDTWGFEGDFKVPHAIGDRLYVREHWKAHIAYEDLAPSKMGGEETVLYLADGALSEPHPDMPERCVGRHRQAMHMPRWASRLTLLVTDVRVQRLQDISEDDCIAEGITRQQVITGMNCYGGPPIEETADRYFSDHLLNDNEGFECPVDAYKSLWNSLHTDPGTRWEDNPWIYAVSSNVVRGNIDNLEGAN
jgi:hypothetical protein